MVRFAERFTEIEKDNRLLLEKMSSIMALEGATKRRFLSAKRPENERSKGSLNSAVRKRELNRIIEENHKFLKRLQDKRSDYNKAKLGEDRQDKEKMIKNICRFPVPTGERNRSVPRKRVSTYLLCSYLL